MRYKKEKEKDISIQDFINFLKINNVYKQFRRNFSVPIKGNSFKVSCRKILTERFSKRKPQTNYDYMDLLEYAFCWEDTKEGWDFWYDVKHSWIVEYFTLNGNKI